MVNKYLMAGAVVLIVVVAYWGVDAVFTTSYDIPTADVNRGEFVISLGANGTVNAKRNHTLSAPRIRGLQITWLAPEGSMVNEGEPVIRFDASQQRNDLADHQSTLKINQTTLDRQTMEFDIQEKQLALELQKAQRNYDEKKHEAPKLAEEARLELELAELNVQAKLDQIKADMEKAQLEVQRAQDRVAMAEKELAQMTMNAPLPGMVVYLEIWKGGSMGKVQEGDSPWPGQGLINLPDLSEMIIEATVSEVDAARVDSGQAVRVTLDAFLDTPYEGDVTKKSTLARRKDHNSKLNVFDVEVTISNHDENMKPGMSASCQIVQESLDSIVYVPIEAVYESDGQTVVYLENRKAREVEVGRRNEMDIEILSGLDGTETICLVNPTIDEQGLPGDKATEPEMNRGRSNGHKSPTRAGAGG